MGTYAEPYQPTSSSDLKWSVILGMAVAMIVLSRATRKTEIARATVRRTSLTPSGYSGSKLAGADSRATDDAAPFSESPPVSPDGVKELLSFSSRAVAGERVLELLSMAARSALGVRKKEAVGNNILLSY